MLTTTRIPEDFNEWYFICASFNPNVIEPVGNGDSNNLVGETYYEEYGKNHNFWLNHVDPLNDGNFTNFSNYGNKCKVEVISKTNLLRARGFKV